MGVIAIELAEGEPPYLRMDPMKAMYKISTNEPYELRKNEFSAALCDFIR